VAEDRYGEDRGTEGINAASKSGAPNAEAPQEEVDRIARAKRREGRWFWMFTREAREAKGVFFWVGWLVAAICAGLSVVAMLWSFEPEPFDVAQHAAHAAKMNGKNVVVGFTTTATAIRIVDTLLNKPGGYLSNDKLPPGVFMDNIPRWEWGVLQQVRDLIKIMRNDFSRAQSQGAEDADLRDAEPRFNIDTEAWMFPAAEDEYAAGAEKLTSYLNRLNDDNEYEAQFFARADNLVTYLDVVEKKLGAMSQRLTASVGQDRINTDLAGDSGARRSTPTPDERTVKTAWMRLDDEFYEARGATWALIHILEAIDTDFKDILEKKNARISLKQVVRELHRTQESVWSPCILNGSGFGWEANHSLVMASYISRANASIIGLKNLLQQG